jgi:hypothetical protein
VRAPRVSRTLNWILCQHARRRVSVTMRFTAGNPLLHSAPETAIDFTSANTGQWSLASFSSFVSENQKCANVKHFDESKYLIRFLILFFSMCGITFVRPL